MNEAIAKRLKRYQRLLDAVKILVADIREFETVSRSDVERVEKIIKEIEAL